MEESRGEVSGLGMSACKFVEGSTQAIHKIIHNYGGNWTWYAIISSLLKGCVLRTIQL